MSSYANFYIRVNDKFAPIGTYSRSTDMYQNFYSILPYEKLVALNPLKLHEVILTTRKKMSSFSETIKENQELRDQFLNAKNISFEDKRVAVEEFNAAIHELEEEIDGLQNVINYVRVLLNIIDDYKYSGISFENDYEHYLYAGIEACGDIDEILNED